MSLSQAQRDLLIVALANKKEAQAIADQFDAVDARQAAAVADIATADGSDAATTQALANATKAKVNALLAAMRTAKLLKE
jgi:hypothetical protein